MKKLNLIDKATIDIFKQIGRAYIKQRKHELTLKACPKCQFETFEKGKCNHCGYEAK